ncbi:protein transport protein SEC31 [Geosmithia morbida]|uniref:Protein transport protein SEC31 n=1 Tax=Geosmithia morbida TaxID=1094350 RepID=A0A9P5D4Q8_9HYPO|nr:protein transport protein SEC31 [Geosmithia morbida]KAF4123796.1 protein transport protein SEC31 [Geosmithia morbida]
MVRLRELPRTAAFAWFPGSGKPLLVTGTRAGAVDDDFSDDSKLEIWDLSLDDQEQGLELQPIASISTESKFYDIAWGAPDAEHPKGIIAGGLESGSLDLWDAEKLISGSSDAAISQTQKHTGPIKAVQFNPLRPQILATAGAKGELFIYDVKDISNPFRLGNAAARSDDIECLAWNRKVSHILATGGTGGFVTVWDLKTKKASLTLNNSRKPVSAIAWDPHNSTKLLTSTPDDNTPVIFLWDLRNSNAPERTLQGHEQGVLSLSWCSQDSDLALSSGKDNKTIVWNPQTGERLGELPELTNWTFQTRFNPHNPNLSATASFDGKITVQTLQNTNPDTSQAAAEKNLNDEDFFSAAQTQPQDASWSLGKAPKWFERPVGVSFGFGGKVVVFKANPSKPGQQRSSSISIANFSVDSDVSSATEKFQSAIASGDLTAICADKIEQSKTDEEKADWQVMQTLVGENPRGKIVEYLGLEEDDLANGEDKPEADEDDKGETAAATDEDGETDETRKKELSKMFDEGDGDDDDFLNGLTATKGAKTDNPFQLFSDSDTSVEKDITKAIMLGNFAKATDICLKEDRMADAFLIANCGGQELVDKVQSAYLSKKSGVPSYMRLLGSVVNKNLWDIVYNAELGNWKEAMAILCTFSDPAEFPDLCEALGDRINDEGSRKDASFCYLVGSKLEKVVSIWVAELEEAEQAGITQAEEGSTFSVHAKSLQNFIEKVTVFREVSKFTDSEKELTSGWKLATLYDKYTEYADILAGHGQLNVAQKYLDLLPSNYAAAEIARNRVRLATQKTTVAPRTAAAAAARQPASASRTSSRVPPGMGYQPTQPTIPAPAPVPSANPYAPTVQAYTPTPQAYAPNPYAPPQNAYAPPAQPGYPGGIAPPPMAGPARNQTPTRPPPAKPKSTENWNDVPMVARAPPPRRSTPSAAPITSPFPGNQQASPSGPPPAGFYGQRSVASPPPPPPKGPAPARVQSPLAGPPQGPPRPSSAANMYAPPPPAVGSAAGQAHTPIPPSASPYNAPPTGPPPSNRYTPAPAPQQATPQPGTVPIAPPPGAVRPPPAANPYAPSPHQPTQSNPSAPAASPYAPLPSAYVPPTATQTAPPQAPPTGPPTGPPPGGRPGPPPGAAPVATPPPAAAAAPPPKQRHPPGDRSHIPADAQPLVEVFSSEMQRVASKAPANFAAQVKDTQKRLGLLFDHLNNEELVQPATIEQLSQIAQAVQSRDYATAQRLQVEIQTNKTDECGNWMVGVKRLISMSKATP